MSGTVFLTRYEYRVGEAVGSVPVQVSRTGSLEGDVSITYGLTGDTATPGADYAGANFTTVIMPAGTAQMTIPVPIVNDAEGEATESLALSLVTVQGATLFAPRTARIYILDDETPAPAPPAEPPLVSDYDVTPVALVQGMNQPVKMVASPLDATRFYVAGKSGTISLVDMDAGTQTTVLDISAKVNDYNDRGIVDIALHPDFPASPYIYVSAVIDPPETQGLSGNAGPDGAGNRFWQVLRYTADSATGYTTIVPGSEMVLLGRAGETLADISGGGALDFTDPAHWDGVSSERYINGADTTPPAVVNGFKQDYLKNDSVSHQGGALAFGPEGALFVSTGDGTSFNYADPRTPDVQSLDSLAGKVLRVDALTGLAYADNPFVTPDLPLDSNKAKVFQLGLRNPFTMTFDADGKLVLTDTGWNSYEEINAGGPGANFGWPYYEGADGGTLYKPPGYRDFAQASSFYAAVDAGQIRITAPFRAFAHDSAAPGFQVQAITGGEAIYSGDVYPAGLKGRFLFTDFVEGEVYMANIADSTDVEFLYDSGAYAPIDFVQGADGHLYYADLVNGTVGRLQITPKSTTPPSNAPVTATIGSGPDALVLRISQDDWDGAAQYTVAVDGVQVGAIQTASALHGSGASDTVTVKGDWAAGGHTLAVSFLNDAYGGSPAADRNLYVDGVDYEGVAIPGATATLYDTGTRSFGFTDTAGGTAPPPSTAPTTTTIGDGPDSLVLKISQDAYQGSAQYVVLVDGIQQGGTLTASALHSSGQSDTVTIQGDWAAGQHSVAVRFLNDLYGGSPATDRNLYLDGIAYDGAAVPGGNAALYDSGTRSFGFTDTAGGTAPPPSTTPTTTTIGTGSETLVLKISQDAYQGSAEYQVLVDGTQIGGTLTASALRSSGQSDTVNVQGDWAAGPHSVTVRFLNDLYGGAPTADRNLYVDGIAFDGVAVAGSTAALYDAGSQSFAFSDPDGAAPPPPSTTPKSTTLGSGPDALVVRISQDYWNGAAQYAVAVDGVPVGGTQTASALHADGQSDTLTILGDWTGPGHSVTVSFLNDAYGGTPATDRNLYVEGATYDDDAVAGGAVAIGGSARTLYDAGSAVIAFA